MTFGLTSTGFITKDLQTIKTELESKYKELFGDDLDVSIDSVAGQEIGALSVKFANIWEALQAVYASMNPDSAEDISLDGVSGMVGVRRLSATSSNVYVILYGDIGTVIPVDHIVRQDETNEELKLQTAVTISLNNVADIDFSVLNVLNSTLYTVTVNGTGYTYTSDGTATAEEIIAGLKVDIDAGGEPVTVVDNLDGTGRIYSTDGYTEFTISIDVNLQVDSQGCPGSYSMVNTGAISVPANTINIIVNPISGLDSVNNLIAGTTGRASETDASLRIRRRELLTGVGAATDEAIRQAVLQEVDNVTNCIVISNRTDVTDGDGRPPHSFETVVSGGDEDEIAQKIWENMPSGIQPTGDITKVITDSQGNNQTIKFSISTNIYIWVDVDYYLNSEETFPDNGEDLIQEYIVAYGIENFNIGDDVIYQRLSIPIYEVPGISTIVITLATSTTPTGPPGAYSATNVTIADDEVSVWAKSRITLTQLP